MSNSKLLALVKGLTLTEKRDLKVFAQMPSNKLMSRDKIALDKLLSLSSQALKKSEKKIWAKLFQQETPAEQNRVKTRLFQMMEKYVSLQQMEKHMEIRMLLQTEFYEKRKIEKLAPLSFNRSKKLLKDEFNFDQKVYLFWLYQQAILREKDVRREDNKVTAMEANLDEFYACNKFRILCELANRQNILKKASSEDRDLASEAQYLRAKIQSKLVEAYYNLFQLISFGHEYDFIKVKRFVEEYEEALRKEHFQEFMAYLMNYCIRKFNDGDLDFTRHYLDFIWKLEEKDMLLVGGLMGIGRLKNTILSLQLAQGADAAQAFLDRYGDKVDQKHEHYLGLTQAAIDLDQNEIGKAQKGIKDFQDSDVYLHDLYYKLTCDKLILKCFYQQKEYQAIRNKVDSIKAYINSGRRLPEDRIAKNLNFLQTISRLAKKEPVNIAKNDFTIPDYLWLTRMLGGNSKPTAT